MGINKTVSLIPEGIIKKRLTYLKNRRKKLIQDIREKEENFYGWPSLDNVIENKARIDELNRLLRHK